MAHPLFDLTKSKRDAINILAVGITFVIIGGELLRWWHSSVTNSCFNAEDPYSDRFYSYPSACFDENKRLFAAAVICFIVGCIELAQGWLSLFYCYTQSLAKTLFYNFLLSVFFTLACSLLLDYVVWFVLGITALYAFYPLIWQILWAIIAFLFVLRTWK
jgi:small-conductance mechanosensitive channel